MGHLRARRGRAHRSGHSQVPIPTKPTIQKALNAAKGDSRAGIDGACPRWHEVFTYAFQSAFLDADRAWNNWIASLTGRRVTPVAESTGGPHASGCQLTQHPRSGSVQDAHARTRPVDPPAGGPQAQGPVGDERLLAEATW